MLRTFSRSRSRSIEHSRFLWLLGLELRLTIA